MLQPVCSMRTAAFTSTQQKPSFMPQDKLAVVARRQMSQVGSSSCVVVTGISLPAALYRPW
jgi:hypothetical protein